MAYDTLSHHGRGHTGLASARSSSVAAGEAEGGTGRRLERLVGSGLAGPIVEALATYAADLENIKCATTTPASVVAGFSTRT